QQLCQRHSANVFSVHPERFVVRPVARIVLVEIEDGIGAADALERKSLRQLFQRKNFLFIFGRPSQQGQEIAKGRGYKSAIPIGCQRDDFTMLALRKFALIRRQDQWQVRKLWLWRAQSFVEQSLLVRISQLIIAEDNV